ncbi:hypothetical protein [Streptomyces sp. CB02460]|uniref:hypothetical protein n=1 Tax=Streptomyces sp. CB02460 TaxID=1703941 RepID=UPI00093DF36B|nr:hypothetical protein [Streptomyces sp. CB02460]OKJ72221.1 hypothetical protein AMK30_20855 [Streptomyces sp. CB02460]
MTISLEPGSEEHWLYLRQLAHYLRHSRQILTAWDHYSARHSDSATFQPYDEDAYGRRQQQRDADTLAAFGRVHYHADELVYIAEQQLAQLPTSGRTRRYAWQVRELHEATDRLYAVYDDWLTVRAALPESAQPGTTAYEEPLAESHAEAWHYLNQWAIHGQALFTVNALAARQSKTGAPTAVAATPAPAVAARVRRGAR